MRGTLRCGRCREVTCLLCRGAEEWGRQHQAPSRGGRSSPNAHLPGARGARGQESEQGGRCRCPAPGDPAPALGCAGRRASVRGAVRLWGVGVQRRGFQSPVLPRETRTTWSAGSPLAGEAGRPPSPATRPCVRPVCGRERRAGTRALARLWLPVLGVTQGHRTRSPSCSGGRGLGVPSLLGNSG